MNETKKMNDRQWWLYRFLKTWHRRWMSEDEIVNAIDSDTAYSGMKYKKNWRNEKGSKCPGIWSDMKTINLSYEVDKIIITKDRKFKMADTEEEANAYYVKPLQKKALKALTRYWAIKRKMDADGQGKIVSLQGVEITDKSRAKRFIEAYADEL